MLLSVFRTAGPQDEAMMMLGAGLITNCNLIIIIACSSPETRCEWWGSQLHGLHNADPEEGWNAGAQGLQAGWRMMQCRSQQLMG